MFRVFFVLALLAAPAQSEILTGPIHVVDADTIELGTPQNIRLVGIDAAEGGQTCSDARGTVLPCGAMATDAARRLYEGRQAQCRVEGHDRGGRPLAVCHVDGRDLNEELVRLGIARIYRGGMEYEDARYFEAQKEAVLLGRGLWAYDMVDPAVHRQEVRLRRATAAPAAQRGSCAIKGNISANGRIYHLPGQRDYDATVIREGRGERWFCSEPEARAAGWRRAKR